MTLRMLPLIVTGTIILAAILLAQLIRHYGNRYRDPDWQERAPKRWGMLAAAPLPLLVALLVLGIASNSAAGGQQAEASLVPTTSPVADICLEWSLIA